MGVSFFEALAEIVGRTDRSRKKEPRIVAGYVSTSRSEYDLGVAKISTVGKLAAGDRLSDLVGSEPVYVYRWVPDYAADEIRPGDYVLLDPEEGRHYGGPRGKLLIARVPTTLLEYQQGDEYKFRGERPKRAYATQW